MKILFYIESLRSGGKERRLVELIKGLKKSYQGIEMEIVLTKKDIHYNEIYETGIKIHYTIRKRLKKDPRIFFQFLKISKQFMPDIVHVWGSMVAVYAIPTKVFLKIPIINNQITDSPLSKVRGLFSHKLSFAFSDKIIANSMAGLKAYHTSPTKGLVIYNGFDFSRINNLATKENIRKQFMIKTKFVVGMVASFSIMKDYTSYVKAANSILEKRQDVSFLCIGSGDDSAYKKMVVPKNKDKILFIGSQQNVESIMNICDIGVLASFSEGISNSIMEFMALSIPVVASGEGGTKELIINGESGFLVDSNNEKALSEKITLLLDNEELRKTMGEKSKVIIENDFEISKMIKKFHNEYKMLCVE